jgi:hypothetical protein
MSSNSSKLGSTWSRTISKKHNGAYVFAHEEGNVTRICWLHVIKGDPLKHFVAEPDRAREVFEATTTDMAAITEVAMTTDMAAIAEVATITDVAAITDVIGSAHDLPGLRNDVTDYGWFMKRVLKDALER